MTGHLPLRFDGVLRPEWVDFAVVSTANCATEQAFLQQLRAHLAPHIAGRVALAKSVTLLQQTVGYRSPLGRERIVAAANEMTALSPELRTALRLRLLLAASPFFADCAGVLVRFAAASDQPMTFGDILERIERRYGQRGSVRRRVHYVLHSMLHLGAAVHGARGWQPSEGLCELAANR
jgi:hypothetical protein